MRLAITFVAPTLLVALGLFGLRDVRWAFLLYVFGACALVPWLVLGVRPLSRAGGLPLRTEEERLWAWKGLPLAAVLFGPVFFTIYALVRSVVTAPEPYVEVLHAYGWQDASQNLYLLLFVLLVPLFEEWWWRSQALPRAVRAWGTRAGIAAAALGFAAYHLVVLWVLYSPALALMRFVGIVVASVIWTLIAHRKGSWLWTYVGHFAADAVLVIAFLLWVLPRA